MLSNLKYNQLNISKKLLLTLNKRLITVKRVSYQLFKQGVEMIKRKEHLTTEGLNKLISIKASINRGLSAELS